MKKYTFLLFFLFLFSSQTFAVEREQLPSDNPSVPVADPSKPQDPSDDPVLPTTTTTTAVIVNIGVNRGGGALETVRQVVGFAVAEGVVSKFISISSVVEEPTPTEPVAGEPNPIGIGGLSFCVEKAFNITPEEFEGFINGLMSIQPFPGTVFSIANSSSCNEEDLQ